MSSCAFLTMLLVLCVALTPMASASPDDPGVVLPMRDRARVVDHLLGQRLDRLVPELMREHQLDMWIIIGREYDEDPVLRTMLPATWLGARRRTILVFHDPGEGGEVERLAVARYRVGDAFEAAWEPEAQPDQWARLAEIVEERNPKRIGLNVSETFAHADGLGCLEGEIHSPIRPDTPLQHLHLQRLVVERKLLIQRLQVPLVDLERQSPFQI